MLLQQLDAAAAAVYTAAWADVIVVRVARIFVDAAPGRELRVSQSAADVAVLVCHAVYESCRVTSCGCHGGGPWQVAQQGVLFAVVVVE